MQRADIRATHFVSILIRPEGRMQRHRLLERCRSPNTVSILIRPEGRMQRAVILPSRPYRHSDPFQSSSGQKAGCNTVVPSRMRCIGIGVSILIRPEGRMQRSGELYGLAGASLFQSSSGQKAGCNSYHGPGFSSRPSGFNPHPARRPDATSIAGLPHPCHSHCFNPHPARRPDATSFDPSIGVALDPRGFNPHPARRPDATRRGQWISSDALEVSILIRPEGRMQPVVDNLFDGCVDPRFNPHPARRPDATSQAQVSITARD